MFLKWGGGEDHLLPHSFFFFLIYLFMYLFIFGYVGSSFPCEGFL